MPIAKYDIFSGRNDKRATWVESVEGLGNAADRMKELAHRTPGSYFVFCPRTHKILASIDTSAKNGQQFVHTLLFECPACHMPVVVGRLSVHGTREAISNEAQNIECLYCELGFRVVVASAREHHIVVWKDSAFPILRAVRS